MKYLVYIFSVVLFFTACSQDKQDTTYTNQIFDTNLTLDENTTYYAGTLYNFSYNEICSNVYYSSMGAAINIRIKDNNITGEIYLAGNYYLLYGYVDEDGKIYFDTNSIIYYDYQTDSMTYTNISFNIYSYIDQDSIYGTWSENVGNYCWGEFSLRISSTK